MFDLAYFKYRCFALVDENDGYFVSRLKKNTNSVITAELREWRGRAISLEGKQIQDVIDGLSRKYIDVRLKRSCLVLPPTDSSLRRSYRDTLSDQPGNGLRLARWNRSDTLRGCIFVAVDNLSKSSEKMGIMA